MSQIDGFVVVTTPSFSSVVHNNGNINIIPSPTTASTKRGIVICRINYLSTILPKIPIIGLKNEVIIAITRLVNSPHCKFRKKYISISAWLVLD